MRIGQWGAGAAKAVAGLLVLAALTACTSTDRFAATQPEQAAAPPPPPPPAPAPPPIDLAGKWKLTVASGGGCFMTLGDSAGAPGGSVAPAGGCPGNFFTSRKWSFEHDMLIIRNHKGEVLAELAFSGDHFAGNATTGAAVTLAR